MSINGDGDLHVYVLSVGQADTSVVVSPNGNLIVIDAYRPYKVVDFLTQLGLPPGAGATIEELIITHPHDDHYRGVSRLLDGYRIGSVTVAPFWNPIGFVGPMYRAIINSIERHGIPLRFAAGYSRVYPDAGAGAAPSAAACRLEVLGPSNNLIRQLASAKVLDENHLSVMVRLWWNKFSMVFAADAQMENWALFDAEGMLDEKCRVLKTAHHGSRNGTQFERLSRLQPRYVLVSSNPDADHHLPDLVGAAVLAGYDTWGKGKPVVCVTRDTGTVHVWVKSSGHIRVTMFGEEPDKNVDLSSGSRLNRASNPTSWDQLLLERAYDLFYIS